MVQFYGSGRNDSARGGQKRALPLGGVGMRGMARKQITFVESDKTNKILHPNFAGNHWPRNQNAKIGHCQCPLLPGVASASACASARFYPPPKG
ncbi:MAG: hypothetical protein GY820_02425 [Gammaproteobacteria bacterium]|nr:hypothetical protein [Gammaproteobacteria bacterium]